MLLDAKASTVLELVVELLSLLLAELAVGTDDETVVVVGLVDIVDDDDDDREDDSVVDFLRLKFGLYKLEERICFKTKPLST